VRYLSSFLAFLLSIYSGMLRQEEYLSTVSAFDQHLNEQATAPLWLRALKQQANIDLLGAVPSADVPPPPGECLTGFCR